MVKSFMFTVFIHLFNKGANLNLQGCKVIDRFGRLTFRQTHNAIREYAIINN
jgi:hypothetical protein